MGRRKMTDLIARDQVRLGATSAVAVCILIVSLVALWQTVWAQQDADLGDAPSSWNSYGALMTAYPWQAPGSANYPVVSSRSVVAPPSPDGYGFCHFNSLSYLGVRSSLEDEADVGTDPDGVNNILPVGPPPDTPNLDGSDDGVIFPPSMPNCSLTTVQVAGYAAIGSYINVWADWNRDGDWNDGSVCSCGDDEWAVQNHAVSAGTFVEQVLVVPCNPGSETDPVWFRVSLTDLPLPLDPKDPEWSRGGTPPGWAPFCFNDGETEDYYVELEEPSCEWMKEVSINDGEFVPPHTGPFGAVLSDTVHISETVQCNFDFDSTLDETWDPLVFSLAYSDTNHGDLDYQGDELIWSTDGVVPAGTAITLTKGLHVQATGWITTVVGERLDISPVEWVFEAPIEFAETVEVGDAPSSWNNLVPAPMSAYLGGPSGSANYPVVAFPPAPPSPDGYGFCHLLGSSSLGAGKSPECEADIGWDADGVNNIVPIHDTPDLDGLDDGVVFPPSMPSCHTTTIQVQGQAVVDSFINVWADWNRDGDWNDGVVCSCGDDEWAVQNWYVPAGLFLQQVPIMPCNPGSNADPVWFRVTLTPLPLPLTDDPEWVAGGSPSYMAPFCFDDGETEDYYVEPEEPACDWVKQVSINGVYAGDWEMGDPGPFGVVVSDTITISDALQCNFFYDWDLVEYWDPSVLSLLDQDSSHGDVVAGTGNLEWSGGDPVKVAPGVWVTLTKTLHVDDHEWIETLIEETLDISPEGAVEPMTRTVHLLELVDGGDAPSSHNHTSSIMNTYNPAFGGVPANFPVVWDAIGALPPGPGGGAYASGYYGFCHFWAANPSFLGNGLTLELDADLMPDQDPWTNINPPADTPNWDLLDDGVTFPGVLSHCGPATLLVQGQNNSGGTLYLNAWADWNRDGDWEDTSLCECAVDEWMIQDYPVPAPAGPPFTFALPITIIPCHPVPDATSPLWVRVTLSGLNLASYGPPFTYGGFPFSEAVAGCFATGETEDYFVESFDVCWWEKEISIDGEGPYAPEEGPFSVVVSDTVTISEALSCTFDFDWDLLEQWDPNALSLQGEDHSHGSDDWDSEHYHWFLPTPNKVLANTVVTMTKELHVDALPSLTTTVISETLNISPAGAVPTWDRPIVLRPFMSCLPLTMKRY
jgi:hypothetical protein